jgi:hypothetical protein
MPLLAAETVTSRDSATGETRQAVAVDTALVKRLLSRR